jgi:ABC-type glycerol-3-phosphate transport system substrate-binding protein
VFFRPALAGPNGAALVSEHVIPIYIIPSFAKNPDAAKEFILHLLDNYADATHESELYTFPAFLDTIPDLFTDGGPLDNDPFGSNPPDKLSVLKSAPDWSTVVGHPGPANAAIGEVFGTFILPNMMASAARGDATPEQAVADAEKQIKDIFSKWRDQGLVGGGSM